MLWTDLRVIDFKIKLNNFGFKNHETIEGKIKKNQNIEHYSLWFC